MEGEGKSKKLRGKGKAKLPSTKDKPPNKTQKITSKKGQPRVMTPAILANPGGRPSDFDEAAPKIISYVKRGNTYECACGCARVSYNTFNRWMRLGRDAEEAEDFDSKYYKFLRDVRQAEMDAENEIVGYWRDAMPQNWQACKEFLARRNSEKWASKERLDVTSNGETVGKPIFLPMKDPDDEEE